MTKKTEVATNDFATGRVPADQKKVIGMLPL